MNPQQNIQNPLGVPEPGEETLAEIKRHPIGIIGVYVTAGVLLLVLALALFVFAPKFITAIGHGKVLSIALVAYLFVAFLTAGFLFIANKVYWGNRWILTSDSITEVTQTSLFNRQSSQLNLASLEDVTAEQNGILTHIFNYGMLKVETAGERSNFSFLYCPNPNHNAQLIISAREKFEQRFQLQRQVAAQPIPQQPVDTIPPPAQV